MAQAFVWDLLVHPFFFFNSMQRPNSKEDWEKNFQSTLEKNYAVMEKVWREHVLALKNDPKRALVIVETSNPYSGQAKRLYDEFVAYAERELGAERCKVMLPNEFGGLEVINSRTGMAMGELHGWCLDSIKGAFESDTGQRLRISKHRSFGSPAPTNSKIMGYRVQKWPNNPNFAQRMETLKRRAQNIARIRRSRL